MARIYATGMGPLPWEKPRLIHGSCSRTWQFLRPVIEAGHEVCLVAVRISDWSAPKDLPQVIRNDRENFKYYLVDEFKIFNDPSFHQKLVDEFKPDVLLGITTPACKPFDWINSQAPFWADIHGYVMGEAQIVADQLKDNKYIFDFWKRYGETIYRADCFSTTSNIQRHAMIGELGALGRLNRYTAGYEFTYSIPLARPAEEIKENGPVLRGKEIPQDAFILFWLGGYNYWCDPQLLFQGIILAMKENEKIHFVSTGGKIDGCNEHTFPEFQSMIEDSPFRSRFHFQGWVNSEDIPNYLAEADAGINTDRVCYESIYGARHRIVEMLRAGLPVITTRMTEISRDMERHGAGLCCPPEDPESLAACILSAAEHPSKLMEMGLRGQELFLERYTDEVTIRPLLDWLRAPEHAPDWGKDIPKREQLFEEKLNSRSLLKKFVDLLKMHNR